MLWISDGHIDYDQIASTYDLRYGALKYEGIASTLLCLARDNSVHRILEVGCGTGRWLAELQAVARQVYGLDVSLRMLKEANEELMGCLVCGQASDLPFSEALFDLILCVNALHHFDHKEDFIREARQALRPGGRLAIIGMDPHSGADHWYLYRYFEGTCEADLVRYPSAASIKKWMTDAGFVQVCSGVAERIVNPLIGREVLQSPFLRKHGTSQLALLTDEAYEAGLNRIKADLRNAETAGRPLRFEVDISLALVRGQAP